MFDCAATVLEHPLLTVPLLQINWLWGGISPTEPYHRTEPYLAKQETIGECSLCSILPAENKVNILTQAQSGHDFPFHFIYIYLKFSSNITFNAECLATIKYN
jgi:hypothetical protein